MASGSHRPRRALTRPTLLVAATLAWLGAVPAAAQEGTAVAVPQPEGDRPSGGATTGADTAEPTASEDPARASARPTLTLRADRERIKLGRRVSFSGRLEPARKGRTVTLKYKKVGGSFEEVGETKTDADGRYELSAKPRRNGVFRATSRRRSGKAIQSRREEVEVRAAIELGARRHQLRVRGLKVKGRLRPRGADRRVTIERQTGKGWLRVAAAKTTRAGDFSARWSSPDLGGYRLRARFRGDELNLGAREALASRVFVYREDEASYYGPGFFGNTTACGQTLRRDTVGVAHKKLRCGTKVRFHYRGRTRRIPVIDRGPFVEGRRWDLTEAARKELRFPKGVDELWADR